MASKREKSRLEQTGEKTRVSRLAALRDATGAARAADWGDAMPELLASLAVSVTRAGGLCSFGRTSDGGALSVTIFLDNDRHTEYIKPHENLDERLEALIVMIDAIG